MKSKDKILKISIQEVLLLILIVLSIHYTEFKIGVVKLSEIILLLLPPFLYTRKLNKYITYFYILFTVWLIISLLFNPFREFPTLEGLSVLKSPYLITIGRYLELIACINLTAISYYYLKKRTIDEIANFVKKIVFLSFILVVFNAAVYLLVDKGLLSSSKLVYTTSSSSFRLKGWYVEGGPYGLMLAFIFVLSSLYKSKYNFLIRVFLIFNIVFLAKSKAGILLLVLWGVIYYYKRIYRKIKTLSIFVIPIGLMIAAFTFIKLAETYIDSNKNMETYMKMRPNDTSLTMGRIAGSHIVPNMVVDNSIFGIGLGNYPIIRNISEYRTFVPYTPKGKTDAHGIGGIIQILVDGGLFILFFFFFIIYVIIKKAYVHNNNLEIYVLAFVSFFLTGVQIYFLYPWVLLGIFIALIQKKND